MPFVPLPTKPASRTGHLSREEARRLIDAAHMPHIRLFLILALTTAGRAGAILDLTWDRVNLDKRTIDLRNPARGETNKGRAFVAMNDRAYEALRRSPRRGDRQPRGGMGRPEGGFRQEGRAPCSSRRRASNARRICCATRRLCRMTESGSIDRGGSAISRAYRHAA